MSGRARRLSRGQVVLARDEGSVRACECAEAGR